jgi:hypothetical protein
MPERIHCQSVVFTGFAGCQSAKVCQVKETQIGGVGAPDGVTHKLPFCISILD